MIILVDLNHALVANHAETKSIPFKDGRIEREVYRVWLITLLKDHYTIMMTGRPEKYRDDTLESMLDLTMWNPDESFWNYGASPIQAKKHYLEKEVLRRGYKLSETLAIDNDAKVREMYERHGVKAIGITGKPFTKLPFANQSHE